MKTFIDFGIWVSWGVVLVFTLLSIGYYLGGGK